MGIKVLVDRRGAFLRQATATATTIAVPVVRNDRQVDAIAHLELAVHAEHVAGVRIGVQRVEVLVRGRRRLQRRTLQVVQRNPVGVVVIEVTVLRLLRLGERIVFKIALAAVLQRRADGVVVIDGPHRLAVHLGHLQIARTAPHVGGVVGEGHPRTHRTEVAGVQAHKGAAIVVVAEGLGEVHATLV